MNNPTGMKVVAWVVPTARVCSDGSYEDGPSFVEMDDEVCDYTRRIGLALVTLADAEDYARQLFAEYQQALSEFDKAYAAYICLGHSDSNERWNEVGEIYAEKGDSLKAILSKLGEKED